jgi:hypothetical protein
MIGFDELLVRLRGLERRELTRWVENRWVLPERHAESWVFLRRQMRRLCDAVATQPPKVREAIRHALPHKVNDG